MSCSITNHCLFWPLCLRTVLSLFSVEFAERVFACSVLVTLNCLLRVVSLTLPLSVSCFFGVLMQRVEMSCRTRFVAPVVALFVASVVALFVASAHAICRIYCAFILSTFRWPYENKFK